MLRLGKTLYLAGRHADARRAAREPYFGQIVQFPLGRALNVKKGYVIALTVPTWAPALTPLLTDHSSWRAVAARASATTPTRRPRRSSLNLVAQYRCLYKARLVYSATLITRPVPNPDR